MKRGRIKETVKSYLSNEIAVDYKACGYFFCIVFFYCVYLVCQGIYSASILYLCEMISAAYLVGYLQVYLFHNFDEAEKIGINEIWGIVICSALHGIFSFWLKWYDRKIKVTVLFVVFMAFAYWSIYLANKIKRSIDTENLNKMLEEFKKGEFHGEESR